MKENCGNIDLKDLPPESLKPPFETKCDQELVDMLRNMQILVSGLHQAPIHGIENLPLATSKDLVVDNTLRIEDA